MSFAQFYFVEAYAAQFSVVSRRRSVAEVCLSSMLVRRGQCIRGPWSLYVGRLQMLHVVFGLRVC